MEKSVEDLDQFIEEAEVRLQNITKELGWSYEDLYKVEPNETRWCPINKNHLVPTDRVEEHAEKCKWIRDGYSKEDIPLPPSFNSGMVIKLTEETQDEIIKKAAAENIGFNLGSCSPLRPVPQTSSRADIDFTRDERLALYDYIIQQVGETKEINDINFVVEHKDNKTKEPTALEIAAAERNAKRRRASYRNKVHTNKKTATEILREVIQSQMECLVEHIQETEGETANKKRRRSPRRHVPSDKHSDRLEENSRNEERTHHDNRYMERDRDEHRTKSRDDYKSRSNDKYRERHRSRSRERSYRDKLNDYKKSKTHLKDNHKHSYESSSREPVDKYGIAGSSYYKNYHSVKKDKSHSSDRRKSDTENNKHKHKNSKHKKKHKHDYSD